MDVKRLLKMLEGHMESEEVLVSVGDEHQLYGLEENLFILNSRKYSNPIEIRRAPVVLRLIPHNGGGQRYEAEVEVDADGNESTVSMRRLKEVFAQSFGISIDQFLPEQILYPLDDDPEGALLFGSQSALGGRAMLIQADIGRLFDPDMKDYFLIGFWGHGINSYAFYYVRVGSGRRIFFRLPYGGVYMDNEKNAAYIVKFMTRFLEFEREIGQNVKDLMAINSMGDEHYRVVTTAGRTYEYEPSSHGEVDFTRIFDYPVIQEPKDADVAKKLPRKLEEYKQRLSSLSKENQDIRSRAVKDTVYKITMLESLLRSSPVVTYKLTKKLEEQYGELDLDIFKNACAVVDDYCRTGGKSVKGGTGL